MNLFKISLNKGTGLNGIKIYPLTFLTYKIDKKRFFELYLKGIKKLELTFKR